MNLPFWLERISVILRNDLRVRSSYRTTTVLGIVSGLSGLLVYGLLGSSASASVTSQDYNMSLAGYLVSGVAFSSIISEGLALFSQHSSPSELEELLVTPTGFREFLLESSIVSMLISLGGAIFFFVTSVLILGISYSYNIPLLALVVLMGVVCSIGLGFAGLGLRLVYKQTALLSWVLFSFTALVGNMVVPVQVLPGIVQDLSYVTPQYYFFTGVRAALGSSSSSPILLLVLFGMYTLVLLGLGLAALDYGLRFVRRNGTHRWT